MCQRQERTHAHFTIVEDTVAAHATTPFFRGASCSPGPRSAVGPTFHATLRLVLHLMRITSIRRSNNLLNKSKREKERSVLTTTLYLAHATQPPVAIAEARRVLYVVPEFANYWSVPQPLTKADMQENLPGSHCHYFAGRGSVDSGPHREVIEVPEPDGWMRQAPSDIKRILGRGVL